MNRIGISSVAIMCVTIWIGSANVLRAQDTEANSTFAKASEATASSATGLGLLEDRNALVALYNATDGANWTDNNGWLTEISISEWSGVTVVFDTDDVNSNDYVSRIDLRNNGLSGALPLAWDNLIQVDGALSSLQVLDLSNNNLTGNIRASIGDLSALRELHLHQNNFTGQIPSELSNLGSLQILALNENNLDGPIPSEFGDLSQLNRLSLYINSLTGTIPDLSGILELLSLGLGENLLSGPIPASLGSALSLDIVDLNSNSFTSIPTELGNLILLRDLRLNGNEISSVPASFQLLTALEDLRLHDNNISFIPDLSGLSDFTNLQLESNFLDFGDLQPNIGINGLSYTPQGLVSDPEFFDLFVGAEENFGPVVGGTGNEYQWFKDGTPLFDETSDSISIVDASLSDAGVYHVEITNPGVPGLTLFSDDYTVTVEPEITITVLVPNGGEIWVQTFSHEIRWNSLNVNGVNIELYEGGEPSLLIASNELNDGLFDWVIPRGVEPGSDFKIRITDIADEFVFDESDLPFTVAATVEPEITITVLAPNGGEIWVQTFSHEIRWTSVNVNGVNIELYKGGAPSLIIASNELNDGLFDWVIPRSIDPDSDYEIRITYVSDDLVFDMSDLPFTVAPGPDPIIAVTNPNGGEILPVLSTVPIEWTSENISGQVNLDLYRGGLFSRIIAINEANDGLYDWLLPADIMPGNDYEVRIASADDGDIFDQSDAPFIISVALDPSIVITRPIGGETFTLLTTEQIQWTSQDVSGNVDIELWKSGIFSRSLAVNEANDGIFSWVIAGDHVPAIDYKIRIISIDDEAVFGESQNFFTIAAPLNPEITVTRPNGGELFTVSTTEQIQWTSQDISGLLIIELWKGGSLDSRIAANVSDDGSFDWLIPSGLVDGSDYRVQISSISDGSVFDESDAPFTIASAPDPRLTVIRPNGGESFFTATNEQIQWTSRDITGLVTIELRRGDSFERTVAANESNDGVFDWLVPENLPDASDYRIRVISSADGSVFDESDAPFTIASAPDPRLTVIRPNGGESFFAATNEQIQWTSQDITGLVTIELRRGESFERTVAANESNDGVFDWLVPENLPDAADYRIRVISSADGSVFGESAAGFAISNPALREIFVTEPNDIAAEVGINIPVEATLPEGYEPQVREVCFKQTGATEFQCSSMTGSGLVLAGNIPGSAVSERGTKYYYSFVRGNVERTVPEFNATSLPFEIQVQINSFTSPVVIESRSYSMISIPLVLDDPRFSAVLPELGNDAVERLLRWNSVTEKYDEAPNISRNFVPGVAFWYISASDTDFSIAGARSVDSSQPFSLMLLPGFNQIGNPFAFPVAWRDIDIEGGSGVDLPVSFDASLGEDDPYRYNQTIIDPWEGYWVNNPTSGNVELLVPPIEASAASKRHSKNTSGSSLALDADYVLQLRAVSQTHKLRDSQNYLGFAAGATEGHDRIDFAEAPGLGNHVRLSIMQDGVRMAGSFKSSEGVGREWVLEVSASLPRGLSADGELIRVSLSEEGVLPDGFSVFVVDDDNRERIPIVESAFDVRLTAEYPVRHLRLIVGTESFAAQESDGITETPSRVVLEQNYPNPFTSTTIIRYQLSSRTNVRLEVYNLLGQKLATLVNRSQDAGWYAEEWNGLDISGKPVSSGTYFYRFVSDEITDTKTMVLVR